MPPKKKGAAKAQATPAKATRAAGPATPATVTSKRGTEYDTTAAAARPRRESAVPPPPAAKTVATKSAAAAAPKKRGRPAKATVDEEEPPKKRGRPSKASIASAAEMAPKRGPGRPPTKKSTPAKAAAAPAASAAPRKRGRPSKAQTNDKEDEVEEEAPPAKKRGRPAAPKKEAPAVPEAETAPPKKRGRPPKGGQTTKIDADDGAANEQLEEELQDTAEEPAKEDISTRKRKAPVSKKGKGAKAKAQKNYDDDLEEDDEAAVANSRKSFWLMKAEQEDREEKLKSGRMFNVKFTIDDLRAKGAPEPWDGVRNASAAKNMRAMKKGDLAFFYASGGKQGRTPSIVGIMEVVKEHEPDQSAWDTDSYGYVVDENMRDRWCVVHVEYRKKLSKPVPLSELKKYTKNGGALSNMQEFKAARLSVSHVTEDEWNFIADKLIEGYEEENEDEDDADDGAPAKADLPKAPSGLHGGGGATLEEALSDAPDGDIPVEEESTVVITEQNVLLDGLPPIMSTETDLATTDTMIPDGTSATSRPASHASRQSSHQPYAAPPAGAELKVNGASSRRGSRAGSLAPPATSRPGSSSGRGRSRTPKLRGGSVAPMAVMVEENAVAMQVIAEDDFAPA